VVLKDRTRGNGHTQKHGTLPLNIRKCFFTVRVTEHWNRLPRDVVEFLSLGILINWPDRVLGNHLWVALLEQGTWTRRLPEVHFNLIYAMIL